MLAFDLQEVADHKRSHEALCQKNQEGRRATISDLLQAGLRPGAIMNLTGYLRGQIRGVQQRLANGEGTARQPGSERPRHNSGIGLVHLDNLARHHRRWSSKTMARSLEQNFPDEAVSERTVRRILHRDLHFKFGKLWKKFKLTELHKQNRVVVSLARGRRLGTSAVPRRVMLRTDSKQRP